MRRPLALLLPLVALAFGSAEAQGPASAPGAAATAWAVKISVPGRADTGTTVVSSPPNAAPAAGSTFDYPADGSVVTASSTTASAGTTTTAAHNVGATSESDVTSLSLFGGEVTASAVTARASAGTGPSGAGGNQNGSVVTDLRVAGQPVSGTKIALGTWGSLTIGASAVDTAAPAGAEGYRGSVTELDLRLTADHGGLPAGSEVRIGFAEAAAQTAPRGATTTTETTTTAPTTTTGEPDGTTTTDVTAGDAPRLRAHPKHKGKAQPLQAAPRLTAGHYVFPAYGAVSYIDTYGAARSDVTYHHGDDIFGRLGQPLVACATGTVFSVGWNKVGGNRLWILDAQGNQYYYAHLSAFATTATNGAHVKAGQVVGFMGNTGDAEGTPYHLHFEIHPVSFLYLGYDGAVDPTPYLDAWSHQQDLPFPIAAGWAPSIPGRPAAPEPGAILLGMNDISSADGLDPASLRRALNPPRRSALMQTLVPTVPPAPKGDLGRG